MRTSYFVALTQFLIMVGIAGTAYASNLPPCPPSGVFHNCFGTETYDGDKYIGEFKDGNRHGHGTYFWGSDSKWSGDKYVGEYKYGLRHGQGTYTFADGSKRVGIFKDGALNGFAIQYRADGTILHKGIFKDGKFLYARDVKTPNKVDNEVVSDAVGFMLGGERGWKSFATAYKVEGCKVEYEQEFGELEIYRRYDFSKANYKSTVTDVGDRKVEFSGEKGLQEAYIYNIEDGTIINDPIGWLGFPTGDSNAIKFSLTDDITFSRFETAFIDLRKECPGKPSKY